MTGARTRTGEARGITRTPVERIAAHEVGHAVVWALLGLVVEDLQVDTTWTGSADGGWCALTGPFDLDAMIEPYLIGLMGGAAAEHRYLTVHLHRSDRDAHAEIVDHWGADIESFDHHTRTHHGRTSREQAFTRARALLDTRTDTIDALTVRLGRELYLPGSTVHASLGNKPATPSGVRHIAASAPDRAAMRENRAGTGPDIPDPRQSAAARRHSRVSRRCTDAGIEARPGPAGPRPHCARCGSRL